MSGLQQRQVTHLYWNASINAWMRRLSADRMKEGRMKQSRRRAAIRHCGRSFFPDLTSVIKKVTALTGGECVAVITVCALTTVWL